MGDVMGRRLRHLIVVVPGIGGSVLSDDRGRPVWGDARRRVVQVLADPERVSLEQAPVLHPTALMASAGHIPPFRLHGYDGLIRGLRNGLDVDRPVRVDTATPTVPGYLRDLSADVVLFPYDFRYGVRSAAERLAEEISIRLAEFPARQRERRVIVVGHSMGGLVARYWAGLPGQAATCRAVITVGTPHQGAPKALDWVINGACIGEGPIRGVTARLLTRVTEVLRGWQAVYDLLPTYRAVKDDSGPDGPVLRPAELAGRLAAGFVLSPAYAAGVDIGQRMHEQIAGSWAGMDPSVRPPVVPFLARDHGTPNAAFLRGGALVVTDADPPWQPNAGWRGDGTVPAISAVPAELQDRRELEHPVPHRHTPMASAGAVIQAVRALTGDAGPVRGDDTGRLRPRLGVDMTDAAVFGDLVPVGARLTGLAAAGVRYRADSVSLWLTTEPADHSLEASTTWMKPSGEGWAATFAPTVPGAWRVTVEATGLPSQAAPRIEDVIAVIDSDDPGHVTADAGGGSGA
jgi:PGAP1-like protein